MGRVAWWTLAWVSGVEVALVLLVVVAVAVVMVVVVSVVALVVLVEWLVQVCGISRDDQLGHSLDQQRQCTHL